MENYDNASGSAAAGGMAAPAGPPMRTPDDSPMLMDPTMRPDEPITAGLPTGPGPGPEALSLDTRGTEATRLKAKWMPVLQPIIEDPDTPDSVRALFRYLRGA
jgi:hypothetical protein